MIRPMLMRLASFALAAVLLPAGIAAAQTMDFACRNLRRLLAGRPALNVIKPQTGY